MFKRKQTNWKRRSVISYKLRDFYPERKIIYTCRCNNKKGSNYEK